MRNIIWKRPDGGVSITRLVDQSGSLDARSAKTSQEEAARLKKHGVVPQDWEAVAFDASCPSDRTFRNAWTHGDVSEPIRVDMERARAIHRERVRLARKPILEALDVDYMRSLETGDVEHQKSIVARKQALRDATLDPIIEAAKTPEALATAIPTAIKAEAK